MEEQNKNIENQTSNKISKSKMGIIIGVIILCIALIAVVLIVVLGGSGNNTPATPEHTHTYDEWKTVKTATCTQEGTKERYCSCGEKQTSAITMSDHTYNEWVTVTESTCKQPGVKERTCSICTHKETGNLALSTNHTYGNLTTKIAATCDATGTKTRTCTVCSKVDTGIIEKTEHNVNSTTGKCSDCGAQISSPQINLTSTNIYEYLSFTATSENVVITDASSKFQHNESGSGSVRVTATKLKNVTFHDVVLVISLETSSTGWGTMSNREIIVPFDGNINSLFTIHAFNSTISANPTYRVKVQSVSGYVTFN